MQCFYWPLTIVGVLEVSSPDEVIRHRARARNLVRCLETTRNLKSRVAKQ